MESFITAIFISAATGGIAFLIKFYFSYIENKLNKLEKETKERIKELDLKVDRLNDAYAKVFNELLSKFSNWEDRIKVLLDDIIKKQMDKKMTLPDTVEMSEIAFRNFDKQTKQELSSIKKEVDSLDKNLKSVEKMIFAGKMGTAIQSPVDEKQINQFKEAINKINVELMDIQNRNSKNYDDLRDKIAVLHTVCKSLNSDCRRLDEKITKVVEESRGKISLR